MKKLKNLALLVSALSFLSLFGCQNPSGPAVPDVPESKISAEIEVESNTIKFVKLPDAKSIPAGKTGYRVDFYTEDGDDYKWLAVYTINSTKNFDDINIDEIIWDKPLNNNVLKLTFNWGVKDENLPLHDDIIISDYQIAAGYEKPVTTINGTVVSITKPGEKILALYPKTHHYTVFIHNEADKWENWLGAKEFALTDNITFDLCDLVSGDPYSIINNQVNICLELKGADESCEKRLTDNNWVPFDGFKYLFYVSENVAGMNNGISLRINNIPEGANSRQIFMVFPSVGELVLHWTDNPVEINANSYFYPFVESNKEYEIKIVYYYNNSSDVQGTIKVTPKGGMGDIIPVNFSDVAAKAEGTDFIWITKPLIMGNNTKGKIRVSFFDGSEVEKGNYASWIGEVDINYSTLKSSSHKGFSLIKENIENNSEIPHFYFAEDPTTLEKLYVEYLYYPDDGSGDYEGLNDINVTFKREMLDLKK